MNNDICNWRSPSENIDEWIEQLLKCEYLLEEEVFQLCTKSKEILQAENNLCEVRTPVTICGDIHGQFYDLMEIFWLIGYPPKENMLFLGDYVDRGYYSLECVCLLLCYRVKYPQWVTLLWGNHESRAITQGYGFYDECFQKYGNSNVWKQLTDIFDFLPLAAIVNQKYLCLHGGLSPNCMKLNLIQELNRQVEVPQNGSMCDLLWSDPSDNQGFMPSSWGAGFFFGEDITKQFVHQNGLQQIIRAHQLFQEGFQSTHDEQILTIFSAPNYCYRCNNLAAIVQIHSDDEKEFYQFEQAERWGEKDILTRS